MADQTIKLFLQSMYVATGFAQLIFITGHYSFLKTFVPSEEKFESTCKEKKEKSLEKLCLSVMPILQTVQSTNDIVISRQPLKDDVQIVLRGDGQKKPDLVLAHYSCVYSEFQNLRRIERASRWYASLNMSVLVLFIAVAIVALPAIVIESLRFWAGLVGTVSFLFNIVIIFTMKILSRVVQQIGN